MKKKKTTFNRRRHEAEGRYVFFIGGLAITCILYAMSNHSAESTGKTNSHTETTATSVETELETEDIEAKETSVAMSANYSEFYTISVKDYSHIGMSARYVEPDIGYVEREETDEAPETTEEISMVEGIAISAEDRLLLEKIVFAESGECSSKAQKGVAWVVLNRMISEKYPDTVHGVVFQYNQFSTADEGKIYYWYWPDNTQYYYREVTEDVITDQVRESVEAAINGDNPVRNKTGFYSDQWISDEERAYREQFEDVIIIDGLIFHGDWT